MMDDILIFGTSQQEHNLRLTTVLERIASSGVTLNKAKCQINQTSILFCGYIINSTGVRPDPVKTEAITNMPVCKNVGDVRRFLGMANQLGHFTPNLAELSQPLHELLHKNRAWCWDSAQQQALDSIKKELSCPPVLALYNPNSETCVSADASSFGLGAVVCQKQANRQWRPIAYQSRSMTPTEQRYAQIEKEALAVTWACERFSHYLRGAKFHVETDHKPLVPLLSTKLLDELPPRILRFRLRLMKYDFHIHHVPGKNLNTADTLSRAPTSSTTQDDNDLQDEASAFVAVVTNTLPATDQRLAEIQACQERDEICSAITKFCSDGWPEKHQLPASLKLYWPHRAKFNLNHEGLLLCGQRIVIPAALQAQVLQQLHTGHQGLTKCRQRAQISTWWPGLSTQLADYVRRCTVCAQKQRQQAEPLISSELPTVPWQRIAADFFEFKSHTYLLVTDYYSRFVELALMSSMTSSQTILHLRFDLRATRLSRRDRDG